MYRCLVPLLALFACGSPTPTPSDEPTPTPEPTGDTGYAGCGDNAPTFSSFTVENGSDHPDADGPSLLFSVAVADADGDLTPSVQLLLLWDTTIDGALDQSASGALIDLQLQGPPECGLPNFEQSFPLSVAGFLDAAEMPMPNDTMIEWQAVLTDNYGVVTERLEGHTGISPVVTICTPGTDGADGVCP